MKIELNQETLDVAQKRLERLIDMTEQARVLACNDGQYAARDKLDRIGAHLRMARAEAGSLTLKAADGVIQTRGGDK